MGWALERLAARFLSLALVGSPASGPLATLVAASVDVIMCSSPAIVHSLPSTVVLHFRISHTMPCAPPL